LRHSHAMPMSVMKSVMTALTLMIVMSMVGI
jgi:hypothetical protein